MRHQDEFGSSRWAIAVRRTGEILGDAGLIQLEAGPDFELGYELARPHWGRGLATEVAIAWRDAAFESLDALG